MSIRKVSGWKRRSIYCSTGPFHAQRGALRPCLAEVGLGTGQPKLLGYLSQNGPSRQRQLADYFEIDPAAVCRMLDSLEKGGFVTRLHRRPGQAQGPGRDHSGGPDGL